MKKNNYYYNSDSNAYSVRTYADTGLVDFCRNKFRFAFEDADRIFLRFPPSFLCLLLFCPKRAITHKSFESASIHTRIAAIHPV